MDKTPSIDQKMNTNTAQVETFDAFIVEAMQSRRAKNITVLNFEKIEKSVCSMFIIANADSSTQVRAIADHIQEDANLNYQRRVIHREGDENALWIILDYGDIVVHVFETASRAYYNLEQLWSDAQITQIASID